jgi:hypothetical protein
MMKSQKEVCNAIHLPSGYNQKRICKSSFGISQPRCQKKKMPNTFFSSAVIKEMFCPMSVTFDFDKCVNHGSTNQHTGL